MKPEWKWESGGGGAGIYRYKLDSDDLSSVTTVNVTAFIPPTNLSEGPHTLYVQEKDSTGNWSEVAYKVVIIDTTKPSSPHLSGSEIINSKRPVWSWTEIPGDYIKYRLNIDSKDMNNGIIISSVNSFSPSTDLDEGIHWLFIQAGDIAGNWSQIDSFKTIIDITPPLKPLVIGIKITNSLRPSWSWSSGGGNGCGIYRYKLDNSDLSDATDLNFTNFTPSTDLDTGIHILYVQERDIAGNWSQIASCSTKIDIDASGVPFVTGYSPTNNVRPIWRWKSGGGINVFRYKLDNSDFSSGATETTDTLFTPSTDLSEGYHILYVQEKDEAGNWSECGQFLIVIDLQPPLPPLVSGTTPTNNKKPVFSWTTTETGMLFFRLKLDSDDFTSGVIETTNLTYTPDTELSEGEHQLYIQQRDMAGNWSSITFYSIVVDLTPPIPPSVIVSNSPTNNTRPIWSWTSGGDGNGFFRFKLDNSDLSQGATKTSALHYRPAENLSEGNHIFYVQEQDAAGNWSPSGSATVVIDTTPPAPPLLSGPIITNNTKPTWKWSSGGGKGYYMYRLDNENIQESPTYTNATTFTPSTNLTEGIHILYIKEQDLAGNWSMTSSFAIEIDITKPNVPIFTSGTSPSPSGTTTLIWKWASGGGGNGKFNFKIDSDVWSNDTAITEYSRTFSEGLHKFYVREKDYAGNYSDSAVSSIYVLPAPSDLSVIGNTILCNVTITWKNNSTTYDSIFVYKRDCEQGKICVCLPGKCYAKIASLVPGTTTFTDGIIANGYNYYYYLSVYKIGVGESNSSTVDFTPSCIDLIPLKEDSQVK